MNSLMKTLVPVSISLLTGIATVVTALLTKNTDNENAWLWVFVVGSLLSSFVEMCVRVKENKKR